VYVDNCSSKAQLAEELVQPADTRGVPIANGTHLNDLTADQIQSLVLTKDTGLDHLVIFSRGKAPRPQLNSHWLASPDIITPDLYRPRQKRTGRRSCPSDAMGQMQPGSTVLKQAIWNSGSGNRHDVGKMALQPDPVREP